MKKLKYGIIGTGNMGSAHLFECYLSGDELFEKADIDFKKSKLKTGKNVLIDTSGSYGLKK